MAKLGTTGRIGQQVGVKAYIAPPTQSTTPTPVAMTDAEYYASQGITQTQKLKTEITEAQRRVAKYGQLIIERRNKNRDATSYENKQDKYQDVVRNLQALKTQASSGKYNYRDLIEYANTKALAASERTVYKRDLVIAKRKADAEEEKRREEEGQTLVFSDEAPNIISYADEKKADTKTVPSSFVGPLRPGVTRIPSAVQPTGAVATTTDYFGKVNNWATDIWKRPQTRDSGSDIISPAFIKYGYDWAATQTIKGGQFLGGATKKAVDYFGPSKTSMTYKFFFDPEKSPISGRAAKEIISSAYMFSSLSPYFKTGTAQVQESKYAYDVKKGKFVKKSDLRDYLTYSKSGKTVKLLGKTSGTYHEKANRLSDLYNAAGSDKERVAVLKIAKSVYGESFVKDFVSQNVRQVFTTTAKVATEAKADVGGYFIEKLPEMSRIDVVETGVKTVQELFQPSAVGETQWLSPQQRQLPLLSFQVPPQTIPKTKTGQLSALSQSTGQLTTPRQTQPQKQIPRQITAPIQVPRIPTPQMPRTPGGIRGGIRIAPKVKLPPIVPFFLPRRKSTIIAAKKRGVSFIPQVKSKKKWITVGKSMDRQSALSRGSRGADMTTSRRFRIKPSNKPAQISGISGWGMRQHKFRRGKKPNTFIERSRFAIDTPTEKAGLSIAKLSKQMKWGLTPVKKKTKKKKKK